MWSRRRGRRCPSGPRWFRRDLEAGRRTEGHHAVPGREGGQTAPPSWSPRPQPLRGRDGECVGCELCAAVCPADCITGAALTTRLTRRCRRASGTGSSTRSTTCAASTAICAWRLARPAITESKMFEFSFTNRSDAIYTKEELVVDDDGLPRQLPWEDWRPGEADYTSGWMRRPRHRARSNTRGKCNGRASSATASVRRRAARAATATTWPRGTSRSGP